MKPKFRSSINDDNFMCELSCAVNVNKCQISKTVQKIYNISAIPY